MSQIRKHTWKGLVVAAAMLLSVGLMTQTVFAAITTTTPADTTVALSTNATTGTGVHTTVTTAVLTNSAAADYAVGTIIITPPTGWQFNAVAPTVTPAAGTLAFGAPTLATTAITLNASAVSNAAGTLTIAGLQIRPITANAQPGFITLSGTSGPTGNLGFVSTVAGQVNIGITSSAATVSSDGTTSTTLTFTPRTLAGALIPNIVVSVTTSRGTLSVSSNTTTSTTCGTGATGSTCTLTFRGNGTIGTANINAVTASPNEGTGTFAIEVIGSTVTPSKFNLRDTTNSGHIAADVTTEYVSTNKETRVRFQVADGNNNGANSELIQVTVDKGYIDVVTGCPTNNTSASATSATVSIDGSNVDGIVSFFVCARPGQNGAIKVTAKNLSTSHADGTATITSAGTPNKIEATVTGNTVAVVVKDKDGNNVAENTPVFFQVPAFTGAVAPACGLTSGGKASGSAAFSGAGGQVLITVTHNSSGGVPGCPSGGNTVSASTTVTVGTGAPPAPGAGNILGTVPSAGRFGLIGVANATTVDALIAAATTAGCNVTSLSITSAATASGWLVHIKGAPAAVNTAFPGTAAVPAGGAGLLCG